jgi:hypothetical protein
MKNIKTIEAINVKKISSIVSMALVILFVPQLFPSQLLAGPIINATLIISLFLFGLRPTLILCFVPSTIALLSGILPVIIAPIVPFIMASNVIYVVIINLSKKISENSSLSYWSGIIFASFAKFLFLFLSVYLVTNLFIEGSVSQKIISMFSWTQLFTAVTGGVIAYFFLKLFKNNNFSD